MPFKSVVTSVNGRVFTLTDEVFPGTVPAGGLKLIVGNVWMNAGVAVVGVSNDPDPSERKNWPVTVVVEMLCTGVTQLTVTVFELI